jgi:hypothetical protein
MTDKSCEDNNYNFDYDELAYPFSKRIKLKHEPEEAVVPMRSLLDTGSTSTIILREFSG